MNVARLSIIFLTVTFAIVAVAVATAFFPISDSASEERDNSTMAYMNIPYANQSQAQKLDLYVPVNGEGLYPVVVWIHGGAWALGDKKDLGISPGVAAERGYALVSINYRLSGESEFPAQIYDCKTAIRWLRAHAKEYGLDPDRIAVAGESAGGHLAALTGTSGDVKELEDLSAGNADESSRVRAVVDWYGPTDLLAVDGYLVQNGYRSWLNNPSSYGRRLMGGNLIEHADLVKAANPETYITPDDPPFLIQHGTSDNLVPPQQSLILTKKLTPVIGEKNAVLDIFKGGRHGDLGPYVFFKTPENLDRVLDFLDQHMV